MKRIIYACIIALLASCGEQPDSPADTQRPGRDSTETPQQPDIQPDIPTDTPTDSVADEPGIPDVTPSHARGGYIHDFVRSEVDIDIYDAEGESVYAVRGEGFECYLTISADGTVRTHDAGGIKSFATAAEQQRRQGLWPDPVLSTEGSLSPDGTMISFGYTDSGGKAVIDYLVLSDSEEWADMGETVYTDAWVLPHVTFKAVKYSPAEHPWRVWMQRSTVTPGLYRIIDLYRGACPLSDANAATAGDIITVDASDPSHVVLGPSATAFVCPDIEPLTVGGRGTATGHSFVFDTPFGQAEIRLPK